MRLSGATLFLVGTVLVSACSVRPGDPLRRHGDEISVCGQLFHTGTDVVLWYDPGGYDAYRTDLRFPDEVSETQRQSLPNGPRYSPFRKRLKKAMLKRITLRGWTLPELQETVAQFVIHYDVCGTSRRCFKVLQDRRGLSVHFMLDVDGTIYQTLDLKERAWHAGAANDRSVGVEIAHIGAYSKPDSKVLAEWYRRDSEGIRVRFPETIKETGIRTEDFVARPAQDQMVVGFVQGRRLYQYDFTEEQYHALAHLVAALTRVFPKLELDYPRAKDGTLRRDALERDKLESYCGLLGHYHVTTRKIDPGPAFDWNRLLRKARSLR